MWTAIRETLVVIVTFLVLTVLILAATTLLFPGPAVRTPEQELRNWGWPRAWLHTERRAKPNGSFKLTQVRTDPANTPVAVGCAACVGALGAFVIAVVRRHTQPRLQQRR